MVKDIEEEMLSDPVVSTTTFETGCIEKSGKEDLAGHQDRAIRRRHVVMYYFNPILDDVDQWHLLPANLPLAGAAIVDLIDQVKDWATKYTRRMHQWVYDSILKFVEKEGGFFMW